MRLFRDALIVILLAAGLPAGVAGCRSVSGPRVAAPSPQPVRIRLLAVNDFHGHLSAGQKLAGRPVGGAAVLAAYLKDAERGFEGRAIVVHSGDHVGASPAVSGLFQDEPSIAILNALANEHCKGAEAPDPRCNVVGTLGNHEFDEGKAELLRLIRGGNHASGPFLEDPYRGARFPYVCANVVDTVTGEPILPPSVVLEAGGRRIGFVGAVLRGTPKIVNRAASARLEFRDEADAINQAVGDLRSLGIRAIVVLIHQGGRQTAYEGPTDLARPGVAGEIVDIVNHLDDDVDVVVSGHTHAFTNARVPTRGGRPILVTQAFDYGKAFASIDLVLDQGTGDVVDSTASVVTTWADSGPGLSPDAAVARTVAAAETRVAPRVDRVVAMARGPISREDNAAGESGLGNLIADAQRHALRADIAFMNRGGIRAEIDAGPVTWGELFEVQPFNGRIVALKMTGRQVLDLLEEQWPAKGSPRILKTSGITYVWDPALSPGHRIVEALVGGRPLDPEAVYTVAVNAYLASGGDGFTVFGRGTDAVEGPVDLDALVDYLGALPQPFGAQVEGRIRRGK